MWPLHLSGYLYVEIRVTWRQKKNKGHRYHLRPRKCIKNSIRPCVGETERRKAVVCRRYRKHHDWCCLSFGFGVFFLLVR